MEDGKKNIPNLNFPRYAFDIDFLPNMNTSDTLTKYAVAYGYTYEAEIFNHDGGGEWKVYFELDERVYSTQCLIYNEEDGFMYYITDQVYKINPAVKGDVTVLGAVPEVIINPGKCAMAKDGENRGILIDEGFLFNLNTSMWESKQPPPLHPWSPTSTPGLWSYQGRPTIFGQPVCDINGNCPAKSVVQYVPESDEWINLGDFRISRALETVVEVPAEFCDPFFPPPWATTTTTSAPTTTSDSGTDLTTTDSGNTATDLTTPTLGDRPNVALIIGGVGDDTFDIYNTVELFGCPGSTEDSIEVANFPRDVYFTASTFVDRDGGHVVACGGHQSTLGIGDIHSNCYDFRAGEDAWQINYMPMNRARYVHMMEMMVDLDDPTGAQTLYPVVYGYWNVSEMYDYTVGAWNDYREMEEDLFSFDCLVENPGDGYYYSIRLHLI